MRMKERRSKVLGPGRVVLGNGMGLGCQTQDPGSLFTFASQKLGWMLSREPPPLGPFRVRWILGTGGGCCVLLSPRIVAALVVSGALEKSLTSGWSCE